ncbi:glycosyltransferase family 4 protein [Microbacterium aurantiacum]|uniref:glycosyltransferase family 4 protein n=1 Tax=Microbacterium aurantiacum TaxID=162393 RepID=UPI004036E937
MRAQRSGCLVNVAQIARADTPRLERVSRLRAQGPAAARLFAACYRGRVRILVVTPWYPTAAAPESGLFVAREAEALSSSHDVEVIHLDWTGADSDSSVASPHLVRRIVLHRTRPLDYWRARRIVAQRAADADVVHTHALTGLVPWLMGRPSRKRWVHSEHWSGLTAPETLSIPQRLALKLLRRRLIAPDLVIAESTRLADAIRLRRAGPLTIVPCVVPPVELARWPEDLEIISIGGLIPRKGPLLAVAAVALLRERGWEARLTWVGDGPLREAAARAAAHSGLSGVVTLAGTLDSGGVASALASSRVFLLPTQGDNFCVVVAEALSSGLPVVSGSATGAVDYAPPEVSRFVKEQSASAYADAVEDLIRATRDWTPERVSRTVAGRFTIDTVRAQLELAYKAAGAP